MIQHHEVLKKQVELFNGSLRGKGFIQKIYSTAFYLCITIRFPGATKYLYLGRGSGHEGIWEGQTAPIKELRAKDQFLEYLRKHLTSGAILSLIVDDVDRILTLAYEKRGQQHILQIFWSGRLLYFLHDYFSESRQRRLFLSWIGREQVINNEDNLDLNSRIERLKDFFLSAGRRKEKESQEINEGRSVKEIKGIEILLKEELKKASLNVEKKKKVKFLQKKIGNIGKDLLTCQSWKLLKNLLNQSDLNLENQNNLKYNNLEIKFKQGMNHFHRADFLYQKIKKLKRGEEILLKRLEETEKELQRNLAQGESQIIRRSEIKVVTPVFGKKNGEKLLKNQDHPLDKNNIQELVLQPGIKLAIGRNVKGNDFLRNKWGSDDDYWFHLDNLASAHLVIKVKSLADLQEWHFPLLGSILVHYSKLELGEIPLVFTQLKNVKGVKGTAGKVILKKQKYLRVNFVPNWRDKILSN